MGTVTLDQDTDAFDISCSEVSGMQRMVRDGKWVDPHSYPEQSKLPFILLAPPLHLNFNSRTRLYHPLEK